MSVNQLNPEYPEHLNPFRKRGNALTQSFRGLKRSIIKSFTGKDKEKPIIRPKQGTETARHTVSSIPAIYIEPPVALPRSRFSERLSKTETLRSRSNDRSLPEKSGPNPFDEAAGNTAKPISNDAEETTVVSPPKPAVRTKLRRRKNRAPVPPGSVNGNGQYLDASMSDSKWSLVSTESDMSSMGYSENEVEHTERDFSKNDEILNLTQEIAKFTEDTNNNNIVNEDDSKLKEVPDIDKKDKDLPKESDKTLDKVNDNVTLDQEDKLELVKPEDLHVNPSVEEDLNKSKSTENINETVHASIEVSEKIVVENVLTEKSLSTTQTNEIRIKVTTTDESHENYKDENSISDTEIQYIDDTPINKSQQTNIDSSPIKSSVDKNSENLQSNIDTDHNENNIEDKGIVKISTKPEDEVVELRSENVETSEDTEYRYSVKGTIDLFECRNSSPTPKVRKNILTKENLLGSE